MMVMEANMTIELLHIAKIGSVSVSGRDDQDAKKRLADYLHTAAGKEQFCEGLSPDEAEEKYQEALFQFYEQGTF